MQKVVGFFSKPENLFVLTLLIGLFTGTYKVVSKASNHNNSLYQRVSSPICFYLRLFGYVYTLPWIGSLLISGGNYEEWLQASKNTEPYRFFIIGLVMIFGSYAMYIPVLLERIARGIIHNHFVINSVSFLDGKRLWKEKNYWQMRTVSDALCREYGLSLIKPVRRGMPYAAWQAEKEGKPNRRKALREDIDRILANENIESLEAFYDTLRAYGYAVMTDRKYVAICPPGGERNIRLQSLGENYEPEALHLRILRIKADRLLGKTKVIEQPMTPKRKMRLQGTVRRKSKAHGIRALYYKWLYYLGVFKRRPKVYGSAFATARWQLNAYIKQFDYVAAHNIKTRDDVEQRLRVVQHEISGQIDEREEIRAVLRRLETGDAEIQEQLEKIEKINAQLKKLRTEAKLCVQILEQQPQIKSKIDKAHEVKTFETERGKENGRTSDHHLEHRRNEAAPTREQRSSGGARSSDPIQRR